MTLHSLDEAMTGLFSYLESIDDIPVTQITQKVAIISIPRSGSSLFCNVLEHTNQFGYPLEWICKGFMEGYQRYFKIPDFNITSYIDYVMRKSVTKNGVFSIHFHVEQYTALLHSGFDIFSLGFDHIYYVNREDKLEQAYSYAKAQITNQWSSNLKCDTEIEGVLSKSLVFESLNSIVKSEEYYEQYLAENIDRVFHYEDFSQLNKTTAYSQVLDDMNIEYGSLQLSTFMQKQRTIEDELAIKKLRAYLSVK
ncbi:Stf0 family sulfotransferase [Pseudoalteromonas aurantia]|uniref:Sulphotransferase Stf0 domain-containing protein n=1 Tax=Pseudoalteromonas aurantia TaxID=43654 RepID=A0A5S3V9F2_9GAMM|nr:Stf0 family sulfotransferase [Pseudoalteromonas aurantia]TMO64188.1 hypothetical protein CWC18_07100 [Pseudoalteromonas aurantia]TMO68532.1 hypothetical protein CWC19_08950 [Pseudoalteromonas aurantia]TMO75178.1 hypothetical protein CWC20_08620 [Pseudoalteromonas aurantia]